MLRRPIHAGAALVAWKCGALFAGVMLVATGCARKTRAQLPSPPPAHTGAIETGVASWYGDPYNGRRAANGEIYDMDQLTAAHRTLPFNTWVEVNNLDNGKQVDVRITDRGPFVAGRIIDLSRAAAREIDMLGAGIARVKLRVIEGPQPSASLPASRPSAQPSSQAVQTPAQSNDRYSAQAGAFADRMRADNLADSLRDRFENVRVVSAPTVWRVLVGRDLTLDDANQLAAKVRAVAGEAVVVRDR
ncbi:MAG TPA: septal ring lytic transglycosylase RlpA family protein [Bryobacteraceae bacterium]|nr:septal ring lytic transglycosylase RlpA family protein [Bryobacteraceae bacterium]